MRVLDAFRPWGATWSCQVISSPPGPSGGPSKTHLLPGGGVPRVHRARSPVPPRLPNFATHRSVHQFAAVAAGPYPLRRPPNAWSPGAPALPGPCYWLVASGTPLGMRGGCLAYWLGRSAVRQYCLGGCSAPSMCLPCHLRPSALEPARAQCGAIGEAVLPLCPPLCPSPLALSCPLSARPLSPCPAPRPWLQGLRPPVSLSPSSLYPLAVHSAEQCARQPSHSLSPLLPPGVLSSWYAARTLYRTRYPRGQAP